MDSLIPTGNDKSIWANAWDLYSLNTPIPGKSNLWNMLCNDAEGNRRVKKLYYILEEGLKIRYPRTGCKYGVWMITAWCTILIIMKKQMLLVNIWYGTELHGVSLRAGVLLYVSDVGVYSCYSQWLCSAEIPGGSLSFRLVTLKTLVILTVLPACILTATLSVVFLLRRCDFFYF